MTLMGGPIDTRRSPTAVNQLAERRGVEWFRANCLQSVPFPYPGFGREVYPGFLQLSGFMAMNFDRHVNAHLDMFNQLVNGDGDSAEKHREFYDEYLAVMDLTAEYYMQTIETVFVRHLLPKGEMTPSRRSRSISSAIRRCALMTVEGENDDISGVGQTAGGARSVRQHSRRRRSCIICSPASAITACSTARAFAPRSRRASPPSTPMSMRSTGRKAGCAGAPRSAAERSDSIHRVSAPAMTFSPPRGILGFSSRLERGTRPCRVGGETERLSSPRRRWRSA